MPLVAGKLWNRRARWMGNLLPAIFYVPLLVWGVYTMWSRSEFIGFGLWLMVAGIAVAWVALNFLGLPGNGFRRREMRRNLGAVEPLADGAVFVGFASQGYRDALDSIEDIGYLEIHPAFLRYRGEALNWEIARRDIVQVRFALNVHSILGLGRWLVVVAKEGGKSKIYRIEPRERDTLLGNRAYSAKLRSKLSAWIAGAK